MLEEISKCFDISSNIISSNFSENCRDSEYFQWRHKNASGNSEFSNTHFRNIPKSLSHIFDANLTHFLPEWKIYVSTIKIMEKLSEILAEIPGGDRALESKNLGFFSFTLLFNLNSTFKTK